jgi:hypothetical protein
MWSPVPWGLDTCLKKVKKMKSKPIYLSYLREWFERSKGIFFYIHILYDKFCIYVYMHIYFIYCNKYECMYMYTYIYKQKQKTNKQLFIKLMAIYIQRIIPGLCSLSDNHATREGRVNTKLFA